MFPDVANVPENTLPIDPNGQLDPEVVVALEQLFFFTKKNVPDNWAINWAPFTATDATSNHNFARKFDPFIVPALHRVRTDDGELINLAIRNLQRGYALGLPTGQAIGATIGETPLTPEELVADFNGAAFVDFPFLQTRTPLWYYVLQEAAVRKNGLRLGPVGGRIVSEVFCGYPQGRSGIDSQFTWMEADTALDDAGSIQFIGPHQLRVAGVRAPKSPTAHDLSPRRTRNNFVHVKMMKCVMSCC